MASELSFCSFNLYNLQLPGKPWRFNEYAPQAYQDKIKWSVDMVKTANTDVFVFQELWSKECLEDIFNGDELNGKYNLIFIKDEWYDIAVAAAIKKPWEVDTKTVHKDFPDGFRLIKREVDHAVSPIQDEDDDIEVVINQFSRSVLQLSLKNSNYPDDDNIEVFAVHLKSKLATRLDNAEANLPILKNHKSTLGAALSTIRRVSEAAALRMLLTNTFKGNNKPGVVIGDFNDGPTSNALAIITEQAKYRLYDTSGVAGSNDDGLYSSAIMQNFRSIKDYVYTHEHDGMKDTLDHILFTEQFYPHSKNCVWSFKEMKVWNDHVEDGLSYTSDHGIVKAVFVRT